MFKTVGGILLAAILTASAVPSETETEERAAGEFDPSVPVTDFLPDKTPVPKTEIKTIYNTTTSTTTTTTAPPPPAHVMAQFIEPAKPDTGGRGWQLAPALEVLWIEADLIAPHRSKAGDGTIGDSAHQSRKSDHNIENGWVDALDLTHDPANGFDAHGFARWIAASNDGRFKYIISNGEIWKPGSGWQPYDGESPHTGHAHFSVADEHRHNTDSPR